MQNFSCVLYICSILFLIEMADDMVVVLSTKSMAGDASNKTFLKKALRGVRTIICPSVSVSMASMESFSILSKTVARKQ